MRKLFDINSPVGQGLAILTDLVIANVLFLLCSVPIVTIGASMTAMAKVCQGIVMQEGSGAAKTFLHAFKQNFKQSTVCWLICLAVMAFLTVDLMFVYNVLTGNLQLVGFCLWILPAGLLLGLMVWLFPLIARYENTVKVHLKNAISLAIAKLPRTVIIALVNLTPIILFLIYPQGALNSSIIWALLGFAFLAYISAMLQKSVFCFLEGRTDGPIPEPEEE